VDFWIRSMRKQGACRFNLDFGAIIQYSEAIWSRTTEMLAFNSEAFSVFWISGGRRSALNFRYKIIALAIVPLVIAVCAITTFLTWQSAHLTQSNIDTFHRDMLKAKETEILNLTNVARSAIQSIYADAGPDDQTAKDRVAAILRSL
jgi:hypothetical protein